MLHISEESVMSECWRRDFDYIGLVLFCTRLPSSVSVDVPTKGVYLSYCKDQEDKMEQDLNKGT